MNNKMPKLEAGMIVELYSNIYDSNYGLYLHISEKWNISLTKNEYCYISENVEVINIYEANHKTWNSFASRNTLIWSKKSEKEIKIDELEKTVKDALKQIEELKREKI